MRYDYAKTFKELRKEMNLPQRSFAQLLGVSRQVVADLESGRSRPRADTLMNFLRLRDQRKRRAGESVQT